VLRRDRDPKVRFGRGAPDPTVGEPVHPARPIEAVVDVRAPAEHILEWFLDPARWPRFQGRHAWLEPRPGGRLRIDLGGGVYVAGNYLEVGERRLVFTWGREGEPALPAGSTTVTVTVEPTGPASCRIELVHEGVPDRLLAAEHLGGWRYHLIRLGVAASGAVDDDELVDLFLAATTEPNRITRRGLLERTCTHDVHVAYRDDDITGLRLLGATIGRLLTVGGGDRRLERSSSVRRAGGMLRCDYELRDDDSQVIERGELIAHVDHTRHMTAVGLLP
jgi:uncharacterized protein YndB with AHSA1/START domain